MYRGRYCVKWRFSLILHLQSVSFCLMILVRVLQVRAPQCNANIRSVNVLLFRFFLFIYHFLREIASLKLNMKVCDAIPKTLYVVSDENAAINNNNRFTERFNFELAFNLLLSKLSIGNTGVTDRVTVFLTTGMSRLFSKLGLNSRSCGLLKIVCLEICFDFLIDWGLVMPQRVNLRH